VDKYIVESNDQRPIFEIERAAKIGTWNGALIRVCEGKECKNSESPDLKFKFCAKCKIVSRFLDRLLLTYSFRTAVCLL
jgi:hypothetical protein